MSARILRLPVNPLEGLNHFEIEAIARDDDVRHSLLGGSLRIECRHCPSTFKRDEDAAWHAMRTKHSVMTTMTTTSVWATRDNVAAYTEASIGRPWGTS
ncbi:hypothetical protein ACOCJ7_07165 [Knoellia sp. CPCC 206453]|uniref:hypothetical protein n=1 Tax=Knoellia pratensis TaxID=3404796 RepID=UPI0036167387